METEKLLERLEEGTVDDLYFLALALLLAFGTLQTTGTVLETDKPVVTVVSCSMYPQMNVGDVVVVNGKDFEDIKEGEIVVYDSRSEDMNIPVIHRVVQKKNDSLETKGDNNPDQLPFEKNVKEGQIHGVTKFSVPRVGLVKLVTMDLIGYGRNDAPLALDSIPACRSRV